MAYKYYYIDDDPEKTIKETARGLSIKKELIEVEPFQHRTWQEELEFLKDNQENFDGLLVDWKLSKKNAQNEEANFNIEALAQQLRTIITKGDLKDLPIVLCSAEYEFKKSFEKESTAQDLFDSIYEKDEFDENKDEVINQLFALSKAYIDLNNDLSLTTILGKNENIDYRLQDHIEHILSTGHPKHDIVRFILKNLVKVSGLLIDEFILAARFGINVIDPESKDDWIKLTAILEPSQYNGILSFGWQRWWAGDIIDWWRENLDSELGDLTAEERVQKLNEKHGLNLQVAVKTDKSKSTVYWTVCKKTKRPISYKDAILSSEDYEKVPWQEDEYYSVDTALEEATSNIHPLDREKVEKLKIRYTKTRDGK